MKVLFFGSSDFSVPFIEAINASGHRIALVLTSADKAKGRGKIMGPNPVKLCAQRLHLNFIEDRDFGVQTMLVLANTDFDCLVVVSFGRIIPNKVLELAGSRTINVHPSLLPKYRGPSPVSAALLNGDSQTGISLTKIKEKFDTGDIYSRLKFSISEDDNKDSLEKKIFLLGAPMLISLLDNFESMTLSARPQSSRGVSYTKIFTKQDFKIDWSKNADEISNKIRAFSSSPGSFVIWKGKYLKILKARIVQLPQGSPMDEKTCAGQVIMAEKAGLLVACGSSFSIQTKKIPDAVSLLMIKPEGKNEMSFNDFINGYRLKPGDSFEQ